MSANASSLPRPALPGGSVSWSAPPAQVLCDQKQVLCDQKQALCDQKQVLRDQK